MIGRAIEYSKQTNRILLINTCNNRTYKINFSDFFSFSNENVVCDTNQIRNIFTSNTRLTVYPSMFKDKLLDMVNEKYLIDNDIHLNEDKRDENVIIYQKSGGIYGYTIFKELMIQPTIQLICNERYNRLKMPYLCIHIRNTDYKCNYEELYKKHKDEIHSANEIYIATDDKSAIDFFKLKELPIQNFTTFPETSYYNLHRSDINSNTKMTDLLSDIYIIGMSDKLLSNSKGLFITLVRSCNKNKDRLIEQYNYKVQLSV